MTIKTCIKCNSILVTLILFTHHTQAKICLSQSPKFRTRKKYLLYNQIQAFPPPACWGISGTLSSVSPKNVGDVANVGWSQLNPCMKIHKSGSPFNNHTNYYKFHIFKLFKGKMAYVKTKSIRVIKQAIKKTGITT